ncbi:MAG: glutamine--tRNA ligase/YqeY domain fusion protein [Phycisphaerales bacterium]
MPDRHFIQQIIDKDIATGKWGAPGDRSVVKTRFPPEPNGFLHIGHAKAITLSHGIAAEFGGTFNLRFDDTNPVKEEDRYVQSIVDNVRWLGATWDGARDDDPMAGVKFASDYFERMYEHARELIRKGLAYVDDQTPEQIRATRGTPTEPGTPSPWRDRPPQESLDLFERMKNGEFPDGSKVLRAKIDMASPNFNLRDPVLYRVLHAHHHRTGDRWKIYPMYDWAHGLEDSYEGITHSLCTLEFENHRPLYDWLLEHLDGVHRPQQIEFARWAPTYMITSKRNLKQLVDEGHVSGWDDPRMPTVSGLRRRGYTADAIRTFCEEGGVTKFNAKIDVTRLENALRDHLNKTAPRRMAVLRPLKVTITNWGEHGEATRVEEMDAVNNPEDESAGARKVPFTGTLYIEQDDFVEEAPNKKWFRLAIGKEVRLRYGYWIACHGVVKNDAGEVVEVLCTYDPLTRGGESPPPDADGNVRKVKGTIHWVSADQCVEGEVRLFDRLYTVEQPGKATGNHLDDLNPDSLEIVRGAKLERSLADASPSDRFQFERLGYFFVDPDSTPGAPVFNRAVTLKDSWAKIAEKE